MIKQIATREVYRNSWMTVREDAIQREDSSPGIFGVVDKPHSALIIPWEDDRLHLVEQYRYPTSCRSWEFPMGTASDLREVDPWELAAQELQEETGLLAQNFTMLGKIAVAPGITSQYSHVFLATELSKGSISRELEEQDMQSASFPRTEIEKMIAVGQINDAQTLAAYTLFLMHERH